MFKIIDRTLTALKVEENHYRKEDLIRMCKLLVKLGVDYIEVSVPLLKQIDTLPEGGHYILKIDSLEEKRQYAGFEKYVMNLPDEKNLDQGIVYEVEGKTVAEIMAMETHKELPEQVRITGMDDMICEDYTEPIAKMIERMRKKVEFCPGDSRYCATALTIEWLKKGGRTVAVSFNGIGGYGKLEEVLMGVKVIMHKKIKQDLSVLAEISEVYEGLTGKRIYYNKAVVGKNIFNLEAGIQLEKGESSPVAYEPYEPEIVGKIRRIVIGKNSGSSAIKLKLMEKGIQVSDELISPLLEVVRDKSMGSGRSLTDREFFGIVQEVLAYEA